MKPIQLNDFLAHRYISGLTYAPDGSKAAFVLSQADEKTNGYRSFLYLYDGELRQLTGLGKESSFVWLDSRHLLFPAASFQQYRPCIEAPGRSGGSSPHRTLLRGKVLCDLGHALALVH